MTRTVSAALALGLLATSVIAAHGVQAATPPPCPTVGPNTGPSTVSTCTATASVTITKGSALTLTVNDGVTYNSPNNMGGTTTGVKCTQSPTNNSAHTTATSSLSASYTSVSTTKQVIYMFCMSPYTVSDPTGSGNGWHVTLTASPWTCKTTVSKGCTAGASMGSSIFYLDVPKVQCADTSGAAYQESCSGNSTPPAVISTSKPIDTTGGVIIASAAKNNGMGLFTFIPRTDVCGSNQQCYNSSGTLLSGSSAYGQLGLYPPTTTKTGTYTSTLTESLVSGPGTVGGSGP